jgi:hypothetical protein
MGVCKPSFDPLLLGKTQTRVSQGLHARVYDVRVDGRTSAGTRRLEPQLRGASI